MQMKKLFTAVLALMLLLRPVSLDTFAATDETAEVYVTISDADGELALAQEKITVTDADGDGSLTINDALYAAHEAKYEGGAGAGYATEAGAYGLSMTKLWGAESGESYGYYVNNASAWSMTEPVADGDYINAFVYTDLITWSDTYCYFDRNAVIAVQNEEITLTLSAAGFDSNFNPIVIPVENATITVNGTATEYKTDTEGKVTVKLETAGNCVISAVSESQTLVPPVCVVTVSTGEVQSLIDGIVGFKQKQSGASSVQEWIDGSLSQNAGSSSEWCVFALSQSGDYDFSSYETALKDYLANHTVASATSRQKYALVLSAIGSNDSYISSVMEDSIGQQGVMSWIYGLHLLHNGYVSTRETEETVKQKLLSLQFEDGGWAIMGTTGDNDVTAMAIQALAAFYETDAEVRTAVEKALALLSSRQLESGDYSSYGVPNPESTAQVLVALSELGIDCEDDDRFIKNGNTLLDGLKKYQLPDGSFCHETDGAYNDNSTVQAFYSLVAYQRMLDGKEGFYRLDNRSADESQLIQEEDKEEETAEINGADNDSYKPIVCLVIAVLTGVICLLLYLTKKRNRKNFLAVLVVAVLAVCFVLFTDFQSADSYYNGADTVKENAIGTVTLTIRCDTVVGKSDAEYIPEDGVILATTEFLIEEGESVYDILTEAARKYGLQMESSGAEGMIYISGINYLYEFAFGEVSGWIYHVNGKSPSVGCGEYILSDGDVIEWLYSCELGKDLE